MTLTEAIDSFSNGIALAEGYFVSGSRAQRNNNPGNLTLDLTGKSIGKDGMFVIYATAADGWEALHKQVELILTNASRIYNSSMTIRQIAEKYTTTDQLAWANNVASAIGIDIDTPVSTLLTQAAEVASIGIGVILVGVLIWYLSTRRK